MSNKLKLYLEEIFLILGSIIGMGFASGKEIDHFFGEFPYALISIIIFIITFNFFYSKVRNFKKKQNIIDFNQFNKVIFPQHAKKINIILIIIYFISASAMLAGLDTLIRSLTGCFIPFGSISLSIINFFILIGGKNRIGNIFLKFVPILLILIFLNIFVNSYSLTNNFSNIFNIVNNFSLDIRKSIKSVIFPLLFFGANFILMISLIIKQKTKNNLIKNLSCIILSIFLFFGCIIITFLKFNSSMPFLISAKNLSFVFYCLYFFAIIIALFSSLVISSYDIVELIPTKSKFLIL
ncbi:MAG: hypothetical protein IJX26_01195, partial [Clostridia bacterium]|nr:hypothetical protein [Clostridia bacterium]